MQSEELKAVFDAQAARYDKQWAGMAPVRDGLYFLLRSVFADLPADSRILCVGVGTGVELAFLARAFPGWRFTAVDPSGAMLEVCRRRAAAEGFISRCDFHEGYLATLPAVEQYDGATCFLVSQFILSQTDRAVFFRDIGKRLVPGGILASSDLASDADPNAYAELLRIWVTMMSSAGVDPEALERARAAYARDVAILPPSLVAALIASGGFEPPVQFYQAGLLHAWRSKRASEC